MGWCTDAWISPSYQEPPWSKKQAASESTHMHSLQVQWLSAADQRDAEKSLSRIKRLSHSPKEAQKIALIGNLKDDVTTEDLKAAFADFKLVDTDTEVRSKSRACVRMCVCAHTHIWTHARVHRLSALKVAGA